MTFETKYLPTLLMMAVKASYDDITKADNVSSCWSTYWKRLQIEDELWIIDDNARTHETRRLLSPRGSVQGSQWDHTKDSVVGFCNSKKNRWGISPGPSIEQSTITSHRLTNDPQLLAANLPFSEESSKQDSFLMRPSRRESLDQKDIELLLPQRRVSDTSLMTFRSSAGSSTMGSLDSIFDDSSSFDCDEGYDDDDKEGDEDQEVQSSPLHSIKECQQQTGLLMPIRRVSTSTSRDIEGVVDCPLSSKTQNPLAALDALLDKGLLMPVRRTSACLVIDRRSSANNASITAPHRSNLECIPELHHQDSLHLADDRSQLGSDHDDDEKEEDVVGIHPCALVHTDSMLLSHQLSRHELRIPKRENNLHREESPIDSIPLTQSVDPDNPGNAKNKGCHGESETSENLAKTTSPIRRTITRTDSRELAQDRRYERRHAIMAEAVACVQASNGLPPLIDIGSHSYDSTTLEYLRAIHQVSTETIHLTNGVVNEEKEKKGSTSQRMSSCQRIKKQFS